VVTRAIVTASAASGGDKGTSSLQGWMMRFAKNFKSIYNLLVSC
jgi:hypothetical protein